MRQEIQAGETAGGRRDQGHPRRAGRGLTLFCAEEKIRVVLEGSSAARESIAELCRREGIASSMYYGWSKRVP